MGLTSHAAPWPNTGKLCGFPLRWNAADSRVAPKPHTAEFRLYRYVQMTLTFSRAGPIEPPLLGRPPARVFGEPSETPVSARLQWIDDEYFRPARPRSGCFWVESPEQETIAAGTRVARRGAGRSAGKAYFRNPDRTR